MSPEHPLLTPDERDELRHTALSRDVLEEQFTDLEQQHECAVLGMWLFLATEVLFFGALFVGLAAYRYQYPDEWEHASEKLNWVVGGLNTVVLLVSSMCAALAVNAARAGNSRRCVLFLLLTVALALAFLGLKGYEYYSDYRDYLIPGWRFRPEEWVGRGLRRDQVPHVELFLFFYWVMTGLHALHVTIGVVVILVVAALAARGAFTPQYYAPVDVTVLYWHFVDIVWIYLFPMLYLIGTHTWSDVHI
jgi:cytochrome c oxidase subunit 3